MKRITRNEVKKLASDYNLRMIIDGLWRDPLWLYAENLLSFPDRDKADPTHEDYDSRYVYLANKFTNADDSITSSYSTAIGHGNTLRGRFSHITGFGNTANSFFETVFGPYGVIASDQTPDSWVVTDRLFTIAKGYDAEHRSDAFNIFKSGFANFSNAIKIGAYSHGIAPATNGTIQYTPANQYEGWYNNQWNRFAFSGEIRKTFLSLEDTPETYLTTALAHMPGAAVTISPWSPYESLIFNPVFGGELNETSAHPGKYFWVGCQCPDRLDAAPYDYQMIVGRKVDGSPSGFAIDFRGASVYIGRGAGLSAYSVDGNAVFSPDGMANIIDGTNNTVFGSGAGNSIVHSSNNIIIGNSIDIANDGLNGYLNIGGQIYGYDSAMKMKGNLSLFAEDEFKRITFPTTAATKYNAAMIGGDASICDLRWTPYSLANTAPAANNSVQLVSTAGAASWATANQFVGNNALTTGYVPYWAGNYFSNSGLYWNSVSGSLGIGTATPTQKIHLYYTQGIANMLAESTLSSSYASFTSKSNGGTLYMLSRGTTHTGTIFGNNNANASQIYAVSQNLLIGTYYANDLILGTNDAERVRILAGGNVGIRLNTPTAYLHIKAGTATASTAPLKFTAGTNLTTPEAGAVEHDGLAWYGTITGGTRKTFAFLESPTFTGTVNFNTSDIIIDTLNPKLTFLQSTSNEDWKLRVGIGTGIANGAFNIFNNRTSKYAISFSSDGDCIIGNTAPVFNGYSRLLVYGGASGANIDAIGEAGSYTDQSTFEAMGSDYFTTFRSAYLQYLGSTFAGSTLGHSNANLARLVMNGDTNLIYTDQQKSIDFWNYSAEHLRIGTTYGSWFKTNVGIGADAAEIYKLYVYANTTTAAVRIYQNSTGDYLDCGGNFRVLKSGGMISAGLTYPTTDGTANQSIVTNGEGVLSWATIGETFWGGWYNGSTFKGITFDDGFVSIGAVGNYGDNGLVVSIPDGDNVSYTGRFFGPNGIWVSKLAVGGDFYNSLGYTFPTTDGTNGQVMITNGAGAVTWTTISAGSSPWVTDTYGIHYNSSIAVGANTVVDAKIYGYTVAASESAVRGYSEQYRGVEGQSLSSDGLYGYSSSGNGVKGVSTTGYAGHFSAGLGILTNKLTIGTMVFPTTDGTNGQTFVTNGSGAISWASVMTNPMTTAGDIIYGGTNGVPTRLAKGQALQVLSIGVTNLPVWSTIVQSKWTDYAGGILRNSPVKIGINASSAYAQLSVNADDANVGIYASASGTKTALQVGSTSSSAAASFDNQGGGYAIQIIQGNIYMGTSLEFSSGAGSIKFGTNTVINSSRVANFASLQIGGTERISSAGVFTPSNGVTGTWTTTDGKTITATNGIITSIV